MTDVNPDTPDAPIEINSSPATAQVYTGLRDIAILLSGSTALLGFASKHDVAGAVAYLQSAPAVPFIAACVTLGTMIYRQWKARRDKAVKVILGHAAPDSVAIVK